MADTREKVLSSYEDEINSLPVELQNVTGVLFASVQAIASTLGKKQEHVRERRTSGQTQKESLDDSSTVDCHHFIATGTGKLSKLTVLGPEATFTSLVELAKEPTTFKHDTAVLDMCDYFGMRTLRAKDEILAMDEPLGRVQALIEFERQAMIRNQIAMLIAAQDSLPMVPEMNAQERSIKENELLTFSSLSAVDLHRADQLQILEQLLHERTAPLPNFTGAVKKVSGDDGSVTKRRFFRNIAAYTFPQILALDKVLEPSIVAKYHPLTDALLFALYWPPPHRRLGRSSWAPSISIPTLASFKMLIPVEKKIDEGMEGTPSEEAKTSSSRPASSGSKGKQSPKVPSKPSSKGASRPTSALPRPGSASQSKTASIVLDSDDTSTNLNAASITSKEKSPSFIVPPPMITQQSLTITPAGKSIVMIKQTTPTLATWLSIYADGKTNISS